MFSISSSQPVSWSSAPAPSVAPVASVPAVGAVASSSRDAQTDSGKSGMGSHGSASPGGARAASETTAAASGAQAAPLLPRERSTDPSTSSALGSDEARAEQRAEDEKRAQEQAAHKLQLQEVLVTVWKASAAVVDVVLGRESANAASAQAVAQGETGLSAAALSSDPGEAAVIEGSDLLPPVARRDQEPWMYTEQGTSSWAPMESGSLISRRV